MSLPPRNTDIAFAIVDLLNSRLAHPLSNAEYAFLTRHIALALHEKQREVETLRDELARCQRLYKKENLANA